MKKNDLSIGDIIKYKVSHWYSGECYGMVKEYSFHNKQETFSVLWFDDADWQGPAFRPIHLRFADRGVTWFKES